MTQDVAPVAAAEPTSCEAILGICSQEARLFIGGLGSAKVPGHQERAALLSVHWPGKA